MRRTRRRRDERLELVGTCGCRSSLAIDCIRGRRLADDVDNAQEASGSEARTLAGGFREVSDSVFAAGWNWRPVFAASTRAKRAAAGALRSCEYCCATFL